MEIVSGISTVIDLGKRAYDLAKKASQVELLEVIMMLREAAIDAKDEILQLRSRLHELEEQAKRRESLVFDGRVYWLPQDADPGPYCQRCHDVDSKLVRLQRTTCNNRPHWDCPGCNNSFDRTSEKPPAT